MVTIKEKFELNNRVILLTGAAGYLGKAMAHGILEAGAELVVVGRRQATLNEFIKMLPEHLQRRCNIIEADILSTSGQKKICSEIHQKYERLDGIVHNAYAGKVGQLNAITDEDFIQACNYSMVAPFRLTQMLAPLLSRSANLRNATSSVVHIASMYGSVSPDPIVYGESGNNNPVHYGASKGGMLQMNRYLACHLADQLIRVNAISPGPFPNIDAEHGIPEFFNTLAKKVPMGHVGKPQELAGPVVFLLSDAASFINGANLSVDGGWTAW